MELDYKMINRENNGYKSHKMRCKCMKAIELVEGKSSAGCILYGSN